MANNFAQNVTVAEEIAFMAEAVEAEAVEAKIAEAEANEMTVEYWAAKDREAQAMAEADRMAWFLGISPERISIYDMDFWEYREYEHERGI